MLGVATWLSLAAVRVCAVKAQLYRCTYSVPRRVLRRELRRELLVATCAPTDAYDGRQAELTVRIIEMTASL